MKKYYQVFSVDVCNTPYAMDYRLIGAENEGDLLDHLEEVLGKDEYIAAKANIDNEYGITKVEDVFTTSPYRVLDRYSYYE